MDKLQTYLNKQTQQRNQAFQQLKYQQYHQNTYQNHHHITKTSWIHKTPQEAIPSKKRPSGSKSQNRESSLDEKRIKNIYINDSRINSKKKMRISEFDTGKKLTKPYSVNAIKKAHYSYSGHKKYNKSEIDLKMRYGYDKSDNVNSETKKLKTTHEKQTKNRRSKSAFSSIYDQFKKKIEKKLILQSSFRTRKGVQIMNPNKVNQDRILIEEDFQLNGKNYHLYSVADGHGTSGHFVSHSLATNLKQKLTNNLKLFRPAVSFQKAYDQLQTTLENDVNLNAEFSGSTLVSVLVQNNKKVTCGNVGDSRAIIGRHIHKDNWEIVRLSMDHKPSCEKERNRILKHGGRVERIRDEYGQFIGPYRVWLPKKQLQGLAMSRSFGDQVSKRVGVIHNPEIMTHMLDKNDKFILVASDGVWQFLSNFEILKIITPFYYENKLEEACESLLKAAYDSWTVEDSSIVDDISFVLVFINEEGRL